MNENRLMVVDDDPGICDVLRDVAKGCNYTTLTTLAESEFEKLYLDFNPTLIILDLSIGDQDGITLLRYLSGKACKCPIIVLSGQDDKVRLTAFRLGGEYGLNMIMHLQKPINIETIAAVLNQIKIKSSDITLERIADAVKMNELVLHYQPMICLKTNKVLGVESLVRWSTPDKTLIYPDDFIPLSEQSSLINTITMWVVEEAFRQCADWNKRNLVLNIQINLSAKLLNNLTLPDEVSDIAKKYKVPTNQFTFEITETGVMRQVQMAMDILTRLRLHGFSTSMDDFGTGYSSLLALHRMPFREIKVDKSFVINLMSDNESAIIAQSIIQLGQNLKMQIVAEGVETKEIWDKLASLGCDIAQGYYISRPIPAVEFESWLQTHTDSNLKFLH